MTSDLEVSLGFLEFPGVHTCDGGNHSPQISLQGLDAGAVAIMVFNPSMRGSYSVLPVDYLGPSPEDSHPGRDPGGQGRHPAGSRCAGTERCRPYRIYRAVSPARRYAPLPVPGLWARRSPRALRWLDQVRTYGLDARARSPVWGGRGDLFPVNAGRPVRRALLPRTSCLRAYPFFLPVTEVWKWKN